MIKTLFLYQNIPGIGKVKRRDELEALLSIFDQDNRTADHHIMNVSEIDFRRNFRSIIRRLQAAVQKKEVRDTMTIEDDFIAEINDYEHRIAESEKQREEALQQKAFEQSLKEEALRRQEEALRKQEEERQQKEEALLKKEEERQQKENAVKLLLSMGIPASEVAGKLGLELTYVERLGEL
ncbi:MAG: hypothetical protein R2795_07615 [Saprospiraceae bacterium]